MKNFELEQMGVQEMDAVEVKETEGGFIPLVIGALLLLGGCRTLKEAQKLGRKE